MKMSRRNFVAAAPAAIALITQIGGPVGVLARSFSGRTTDPLSRMTSATFLPYVGTDFTFRSNNGGTVTLRLSELVDHRPVDYVPTGRGEECFALRFTGSARQPLVQDSYTVDHFALGSFSLFITENGASRKTLVYEALFNRLTH